MTGSMIAVWQGPFKDAQLHASTQLPYGGHIRLLAGQAGGSTVVLSTVASQMALSDPSWWTFH